MLSGHVWTISSHLWQRFRPPTVPASTLWSVQVTDDRMGRLALGGHLSVCSGSETLLLLVHGLGGSSQSGYMRRAAAAAQRLGISSLRIDLRGADGKGEDLYHAGLSSDLEQVLQDEQLSHYRRILLLGFSLGGHVTLRLAALHSVPNLKAVAAVCPPLELLSAATAFDAMAWPAYRHHVLSSLKDMYRAVARKRVDLPVGVGVANSVRSIREWDERIVAPRFGFDSALSYYEYASVAPVLGQVPVPALLVSARHDPMVPRHAVAPFRDGLPSHIEVVEQDRGGHVAFPGSFSLGESAPPGLDSQLIAWLLRTSAKPLEVH